MFNHKKSVVLSDHTYFHMLLASQEASKNPFQLWRWPNFLKELTGHSSSMSGTKLVAFKSTTRRNALNNPKRKLGLSLLFYERDVMTSDSRDQPPKKSECTHTLKPLTPALFFFRAPAPQMFYCYSMVSPFLPDPANLSIWSAGVPITVSGAVSESTNICGRSETCVERVQKVLRPRYSG